MKEMEKESHKGKSVQLELKLHGKNISINYCEDERLKIDVGKNASKVSLELSSHSSESAQTTRSDRSRENLKSDNITLSHPTTSNCSISKQSTELTQTFRTRAENVNTVSTDVLEVIPRENETDEELELDDSPKWLCLTTPSAANRRLDTGITHQMSSNATDDLALLGATLYLICLWIEQLWFKIMTAKLIRCIPQKDKKEYLSFPAVGAFPESFFSLRERIKNVAATTGNMKWCITTFDVLLTDIFSNNHSYYVDALRLHGLETQMEGELLTIKDSLKLSEANMESANNPGIESYVSGLGFKAASCARIMSHSSEHDTELNQSSPRESVAPSLVTTLTQKGLEIKSTNGGRLHPSDRKSSSDLKATDRQPADTETQLRTKSNVGTNTTTDGNPPCSNTQHDEGELDKYDKFHTLEKLFTEKNKAAQIGAWLQTEEVDNLSIPLPCDSKSDNLNKTAIPLNNDTEGSNDSSFSLQSASKSQITTNDSAVLGKTGLQTEADEIDSEALTNDRDILNYAPDENENSRRKDQRKTTETQVRDNNKHFGSGEPMRDVCKKGMTIMRSCRTKSRRVASYGISVTRRVPPFHPSPCRKSTSTATLLIAVIYLRRQKEEWKVHIMPLEAVVHPPYFRKEKWAPNQGSNATLTDSLPECYLGFGSEALPTACPNVSSPELAAAECSNSQSKETDGQDTAEKGANPRGYHRKGIIQAQTTTTANQGACLPTKYSGDNEGRYSFENYEDSSNNAVYLHSEVMHDSEPVTGNPAEETQSQKGSEDNTAVTENREVDATAHVEGQLQIYGPQQLANSSNSRRKDQRQTTETQVRDNNKHFGSGEPKRHVCKKDTTIMSRTKSRRVASYRIAFTRKVPRFHLRPYRKSSSTASLTRQSVGQGLKPCTKLPHNKQAKYGKKNEQYSGSASDEQRWDSKITVEQTSTTSEWSKTLQPLWRQHLRRVHCMRRQIGKWKGRKMPPNVIGVLLEVISMRPPGRERWLPIQGSTRTFTTSRSESNLSLESEIFPTAAGRPFSSPISAASDHSGSQDKGQVGQKAAQKGPNPHGHNKQKGCHETSVTNTADKDDFLSANSSDGNKGRHWLDNQSSSKTTGCLNSEIIQNPPTHIAAHVLQVQITGNEEFSAKSKPAPDVARHSAAAEGQVQDDQKPASSSNYIADNPSPSQSKTSPIISTSGNVTAVNGVDVGTENPQTAGHAVKGEKISKQTTQNDQAHDSNTKRGTTSSANVKSCSIPIAEILEYAGCTMEIIKLKEEIIYELRMGSSFFPLKTIYGLALRCFPDMNQWEIDRLTDPFNATITSRETSVRNVLNEMKARGLKYGHLVQYFSQEDSKRVDILQLIDKIHPTCEHCSYVDTN